MNNGGITDLPGTVVLLWEEVRWLWDRVYIYFCRLCFFISFFGKHWYIKCQFTVRFFYLYSLHRSQDDAFLYSLHHFIHCSCLHVQQGSCFLSNENEYWCWDCFLSLLWQFFLNQCSVLSLFWQLPLFRYNIMTACLIFSFWCQNSPDLSRQGLH